MSQKSDIQKSSSERLVRDIRPATRRHYSAAEKIRIVLDGLRGEHSIGDVVRAGRRDSSRRADTPLAVSLTPGLSTTVS